MLIFLWAFPIFCFSQNRVIDSLLKISEKQTDSALVDTYNELVWRYRLVNAQKAIDYGNKAILLGQKLKYTKGLAQSYNDLGIIYYDKQDFGTALDLYNKSLEIRKKQNDGKGIGSLYNKIGIVYQKKGEFSTALDYQLKALKLFNDARYDIGISYSLNNIGILNQNMGLYDEALKYHAQSLAIKEKLKDNYGMAGSYVNLGNIYYIKNDNKKAKEFFLKSIDIASGLGDKEYLSNALNNLSRTLIKNDEYADAEKIINESMALRKSINDTKGVVSCMNNLGFVAFRLKKYDEAEKFLSGALSLAGTQASCKPELIDTYTILSRVYEAKGHFSKASAAKDSLIAVNATVYDASLKDKFAELQTKYETLQKEQKIELLNRDNSIKTLEIKNQRLQIERNIFELTQNKLALSEAALGLATGKLEIQNKNKIILTQQLDSAKQASKVNELHKTSEIQQLEIQKKRSQITILIILFSLLPLIGFLLYRMYKTRQEQRLQQRVLKEQEAAAKAVLDAEEKERQRLARELHDGVGQVMSVTKMNMSVIEEMMQHLPQENKILFNKTLEMIDHSCKEIRTISHQMMPVAIENLGFAEALRDLVNKSGSSKLKTTFFADDTFGVQDIHRQAVLYRVVQENINNVIKHSGASELNVSVVEDDGNLSIMIQDNGRGFNFNEKIKSGSGVGLENITSRIQYLKGEIHFDSVVNNGTTVIITVPGDDKL